MIRYYSLSLIILLMVVRVVFFLTKQPTFPNGTRIRMTDQVLSEPIRYEFSQRISLQGFKFYLPNYPEVYYGDEIVVEGMVEGDKLKNPKLIEVKEAKGVFYQLRKKLNNFYKSALPEPHSSLVAGMALGSKTKMPQDFWEDLKTSGTIHVVVASGMNVTLVAGFLLNVLVIFFRRRKAILGVLFGIWFYALLAGFEAPIVRAAIMGSIGFVAQAFGRLNLAWRGLFLSGFGMLILKPAWLADLGFILSFVATASLMFFETRMRKFFSKIPLLFREGLSTSLAAQIGVAPILLVTFGQFNLFSPLANALVLWTVPVITIISMLAAILSFFSIQIGNLIILLSYPLTSWFIWVVAFFG